jgi:hypothetical protein
VIGCGKNVLSKMRGIFTFSGERDNYPALDLFSTFDACSKA